jgi:phage terminase large subunit
MSFNISELTITFPNGARIFLMGADNYHALRGMHLNGVVMDEVAQMDPEVWTVVRLTLTNKKGWVIFIGTKNGEDLFYELYRMAENKDDWWRVMINAYQSGTLSEEEIESSRKEMGQEAFDMEMGDSWTSSLKGSYYLDIINQMDDKGQIKEVNWDPSLPVVTAWDLGMSDRTCIWFAQVDKGTINIIDYYENSDKITNHYVNVILEKPYTYRYHILPHDAKQRNPETGRTRIDLLESLGLRVEVAEKTSIIDGIHSVRVLLPKCNFDRAACKLGLKALRHYRTEYDSMRQIYSDHPRKDWSNHASDAFRYLAVTIKTDTIRRPHQSAITSFNPFDYRPDGPNLDLYN